MFFDNLHEDKQLAIITNEKQVTYGQLKQCMDTYSFKSAQKELILILCTNSVEIVAAYVAALQAGHAVMLVHAETNQELLTQIVITYQPKWIIGGYQFDGYTYQDNKWLKNHSQPVKIHPDLAVLLSTSGTTGSPKFVRLSYRNIQSNAEAIVQYLNINEKERAILNLPLSYSYGLSILNSHLQAGAAVLLTEESVMSKDFWNFVKENGATSLPGVPFTYQMLNRIGFTKMELPDLKVLTQAGGRLDTRLVKIFADYAKEHNKLFYVMYGQTEAAPRMSFIPPEKLLEKCGTIGIAIPNGRFEIAEVTNELIYYGPNVMMGYAESIEDLAIGDECHGKLYTGDCGKMDGEGYLTITGRLKRFLKLFGLRVNLDEIERKLESILSSAVACVGNDDKLLIVLEDESLISEAKDAIERLYKLHKSAYKVMSVTQIPRMSNGKIDYKTIKDELV